MDEIKPNLEGSVANLKESVANVKETVSKLVDQGGAAVDALKSRAGEVEQEVKARSTSFVQANPFAAVAIAFGIGYVAMRIRTSPFIKIGLVAALGYFGNRAIRH